VIAAAVTILETLGFLVAQTEFDRIVTDPAIAAALTSTHRDSSASRLLRSMPTLFAMHRKVEPVAGVFFVRVLGPGQTPSDEERDAYARFFPEKVALLEVDEKRKQARARWAHENDEPQPLLDFLIRSGVEPGDREVRAAQATGWQLRA